MKPYASKPKYNNKKVTVDGITFDSLAESKYYEMLKFQKSHGHIQGFIVQPRYVLQPSFRFDGKLHRAIEYRADFEVLLNDGTKKTVDVKGMQLPLFKIKAKWFINKYQQPLYLAKYYKRKNEIVEEKF